MAHTTPPQPSLGARWDERGSIPTVTSAASTAAQSLARMALMRARTLVVPSVEHDEAAFFR
nr:hypothetical protein [Deltaproteobacteria bacterium]